MILMKLNFPLTVLAIIILTAIVAIAAMNGGNIISLSMLSQRSGMMNQPIEVNLNVDEVFSRLPETTEIQQSIKNLCKKEFETYLHEPYEELKPNTIFENFALPLIRARLQQEFYNINVEVIAYLKENYPEYSTDDIHNLMRRIKFKQIY